jgi:probable HAF family extracellular repeat protein
MLTFKLKSLLLAVTLILSAEGALASSIEYSISDLGLCGTNSNYAGTSDGWSLPNTGGWSFSNQMVGKYANTAEGFVRINGVSTGIGGLPGSSTGDSNLNAVNSAGAAAGSAINANDNTVAVIYSGGALHDLSSVLGGTFSEALAINTSGQITGDVLDSSGLSHAFISDGSTAVLLPALEAGGWSMGVGISDNGWVTGYASVSGGATEHAFLYNGSISLDLGALSGQYSSGNSVNSSGWVVGTTDTDVFLYDGVAMRGLTSLLDATSSAVWSLSDAYTINDADQIIGTAGLKSAYGECHNILMTPASGTVVTPSTPVTYIFRSPLPGVTAPK